MRQMTIKEVQQVSLEILKDVHEFCVENNIHYSLSGGSLLGAIRHNGFIPWDDDVDIQLPRPDYDRFIKTYQSKKGYKLYCHEMEGKKMAYPYTRVCDLHRTFVDTGIMPWCPERVGIWIDILPCDGMPSEKKDAIKQLRILKRLTRYTYWAGFKGRPIYLFRKGKDLKSKMKYVVKKLLSHLLFFEPFSKLMKERKKYEWYSSTFFLATPRNGIGEWQPKKNMENFELHKFEDTELYIMSGYETNLRSLYGNYMQLPPENERFSHDYNRYYWKE